jgi:hypothetical protein
LIHNESVVLLQTPWQNVGVISVHIWNSAQDNESGRCRPQVAHGQLLFITSMIFISAYLKNKQLRHRSSQVKGRARKLRAEVKERGEFVYDKDMPVLFVEKTKGNSVFWPICTSPQY